MPIPTFACRNCGVAGSRRAIEDIAERVFELGAKARGIITTFVRSIEPLSADAREVLALASG